MRNFRYFKKPKIDLPLGVVLEGQSWRLTGLLATSVALWMVLLDKDGAAAWGLFFHNIDFGHRWTDELLKYSLIMAFGAVAASIAVGALTLNLRPPSKEDWRCRTFRSSIALFIVDLMCINQLYDSLEKLSKYCEDGGDIPWTSPLAHMYLVSIGCFCTIGANILYIRLFGCCVFLQIGDNAGSSVTERGQNWIKKEFTQSEINRIQIEPPIQLNMSQDMSSVETSSKIEVEIENKSIEFPPGVAAESSSDHLNENKLSRSKAMVRWDTIRMLEKGNSRRVTESVDDVKVDQTQEQVKEDETQYKDEISEEQCQKSVEKIVTMLNMLPDPYKAFKFSRSIFKEAYDMVKEEPGVFRYSVWIKNAAFTSAIVLIYTCIRSIQLLRDSIDKCSQYRDIIRENSEEFERVLTDAGLLDGSMDIMKNLFVKLFLYIDTILPEMRYTLIIGYIIGTFIGMYSLFANMAQHKKLSIVIESEIADIELDANDEPKVNPWPGIEKKYPINEAVYFLSILCSTAVLQLHIFGLTIGVVIAMLINVEHLNILLNLFGWYILAYILIFLIDRLLLNYLPSLIISDGMKIEHPRWFFYYMMVFSTVHLVMGLLYALWRLLYLVATSVFVVNRLDICLFTAFKSLDNGHNAFMSMLLMTQLIQVDRKIYQRKASRANIMDENNVT